LFRRTPAELRRRNRGTLRPHAAGEVAKGAPFDCLITGDAHCAA
jgi:hypothetical protein